MFSLHLFQTASADRDFHHHRQQQEQQQALSHPTSNAQFLQQQAESLKREALDARLENESPYMDQMELSLAAAAAAAAAAHHHHSSGMPHPNSRHHDLENNLHKEFTPSSPMSLPSHFNPREGPPHPPSPLQFPGMSSALTLTPPHHSEFITFLSFLFVLFEIHLKEKNIFSFFRWFNFPLHNLSLCGTH